MNKDSIRSIIEIPGKCYIISDYDNNVYIRCHGWYMLVDIKTSGPTLHDLIKDVLEYEDNLVNA